MLRITTSSIPHPALVSKRTLQEVTNNSPLRSPKRILLLITNTLQMVKPTLRTLSNTLRVTSSILLLANNILHLIKNTRLLIINHILQMPSQLLRIISNIILPPMDSNMLIIRMAIHHLDYQRYILYTLSQYNHANVDKATAESSILTTARSRYILAASSSRIWSTREHSGHSEQGYIRSDHNIKGRFCTESLG